MITLLKTWKGAVEINGTLYDNVERAISDFKTRSDISSIKLLAVHETRVNERPERVKNDATDTETHVTDLRPVHDEWRPDTVYRITVRQYMTKPATPDFNFMAQWNDNHPMPLRTMQGTVLKETRGMIMMQLTGEGLATCTCMRCGKELTNPISRHYGIGPECMNKLGLTREIDDIEGIKEDLSELEWTGWIVKSSITSKEEVVE